MKYLIAGGGTAGHINPAIAIAKHIKENEKYAEIKFVGTKKGMESELVSREGFEIEFIEVKGFRRKLSIYTIKTAFTLFKGLSQAAHIIDKFKPDIVIGTGGYVAGPVLYKASKRKIPTIVHEQNAFPGVTNKILSRYVNAVAISFKESRKYFKRQEKIFFTGNPIRKEVLNTDKITARTELNIDTKKPLVLIFGGSLGAEKINLSTIEMINTKEIQFNLIYGTGKKHYEGLLKKVNKILPENIRIQPYIYDMGKVMSAADLVVCRAGAITLSELTALGVPSILIPSPYVTANHQEHNARTLEHNGAAVVILEKDLDGDMLYGQINELIKNTDLLKRMSSNAKKNGITDATNRIYNIIKQIKK